MVSQYHKAFNGGEYDDICSMCKNAQIGCVACKKLLIQSLENLLIPMREKRAYYEQHPQFIKEIIQSGTEKANKIGAAQLEKVKNAMNILL